MIAVSIALVIWTAGLSYFTALHERARKAEQIPEVQQDEDEDKAS